MVELALPRQLHAIGQRAIVEATARRAGTVEAEHLLLAILARPREPAATALAQVGLDYDALTDALDSERSRSLTIAGVIPPTRAGLAATARTTVPPWGASIRVVLRGADKSAAKDGRSDSLEIARAVAILSVEIGTVPRALAIASVDKAKAIADLAGRRDLPL
jgi:ATP-dependent Clp protease ATP-binding subunit ClpA